MVTYGKKVGELRNLGCHIHIWRSRKWLLRIWLTGEEIRCILRITRFIKIIVEFI